VRGSSPESPGRRVRVIFLVYCIASLFYYVFMWSLAPTWYNYFPTFMARYSLFVLKVLLNPSKQASKQTWLRITGSLGLVFVVVVDISSAENLSSFLLI